MLKAYINNPRVEIEICGELWDMVRDINVLISYIYESLPAGADELFRDRLCESLNHPDNPAWQKAAASGCNPEAAK